MLEPAMISHDHGIDAWDFSDDSCFTAIVRLSPLFRHYLHMAKLEPEYYRI